MIRKCFYASKEFAVKHNDKFNRISTPIADSYINDHFSTRKPYTVGCYTFTPEDLVSHVVFVVKKGDGLQQLTEFLDSNQVPYVLESYAETCRVWIFIEPTPGSVAY